jgi:ParB-like chromosome segregation protein Spo0J
MARKAFVVNEALREKVRHLAGIGVRQDDIAKIIGCAPKTLRKRCREDLDCGVAEANALVAAICSPKPRPAMSRRRSFG